MGKLILVTGGVRSGKSKFATDYAAKAGKKIAFIATCVPRDAEMERRVRLHQKDRPSQWTTIEEPFDIVAALSKVPPKTDAVIVDCLTLLTTNLLLSGKKEAGIIKAVKAIAATVKKSSLQVVMVTNEVGSGIVPENKLAREFRDIAGRVNQTAAAGSDEVYALIAGIPLRLK